MPKITILVLISAMAIAVALVPSSPGALNNKTGVWKVETSPIENTYKDLEANLVKQLNVDTLWTDPKQRETLLSLIQAAGVLRTPLAVPVLIKYLNFEPYPNDLEKRLLPFDVQFPATGALVKIGLSAIPELLDVIKFNPEKAAAPSVNVNSAATPEQDTLQRRAIAIHCIIEIDAQAGHGADVDKRAQGKAMARYRIELEIKRSYNEVKTRLEDVLTWPTLKP